MTLLHAVLLASAFAGSNASPLRMLDAGKVAGVEIPHAGDHVLATNDISNDGFSVLQHLSGISPYFDSPGVALPRNPPPTCKVRTAAYFIRHSNIYANDFDYEQFIQPFTQKVFNFGSQRSNFTALPQLAFLVNWSTPITDPDEQVEKITPSGAQSAKALGAVLAKLYPDLIAEAKNASAFNLWTADAERDLSSATAFAEGLLGSTPQVLNTTASTGGVTVVRVSENETLAANTLVPHETCDQFDASAGSNPTNAFLNVYAAPIAKRFNDAVPAFNFTPNDIFAMQELCGYETVITNASDFCQAFEPNDWLGFEYANDLDYFYELGYGQPLAPTLGIPWVNATAQLLASNTPSQPLYISFSHREEPPFVLTALNLFNNSAYSNTNVNDTMPTSEINYNRAWKTSEILPFLGHIALERLECEPQQANNNTTPAFSPDVYVRALVNSAPIPIPGCQSGPGASCPLGQFVQYIQDRTAMYGDFVGACGLSNGTNTLGIYQGDVPQVSDSGSDR